MNVLEDEARRKHEIVQMEKQLGEVKQIEFENMTYEDLFNMGMHTIKCGRDCTVMRVPGGWIYDMKTRDIFVPILQKK